MPVTLEQAAANATTATDLTITDEFAKSSYLADRLTFDDIVNPAGGGAVLSYKYRRLAETRGAHFRAINTEYKPIEVSTVTASVDLKQLGGSFQLDRILAKIGPAATGEIALQMGELVKGATRTLSDAVINGDSDRDGDEFDGLSKILRGTSTEVNAGGPALNLAASAITDKATALNAIEAIDAWLSLLDARPDALLMNRLAKARFKRIGAWADLATKGNDRFGGIVDEYDGIPLIDLGERATSSDPVISMGRDIDSSQWTAQVTGTPTGGTFTLVVAGEATAPIAYNATNADYKSAIDAVDSAPSVTVTGTTTKTLVFAGDEPVSVALGNNSLTGGTSPTVAVASSGTGTAAGLTDIYAVRFGLDGFHGVSTAGGNIVQTWLPRFDLPGAVKTGEAEIGPLAVVLKRTKAAGVYRNVQVL
jgi:hypothetical protein